VEEIFYHEDGETLAQAAQRGGQCPIPGAIPGQAGQDSEQPGLVEDAPARYGGDWAGWALKVPSNPRHSRIQAALGGGGQQRGSAGFAKPPGQGQGRFDPGGPAKHRTSEMGPEKQRKEHWTGLIPPAQAAFFRALQFWPC